MKSLQDALPQKQRRKTGDAHDRSRLRLARRDEKLRRTLRRGFQPLDIFDRHQKRNRAVWPADSLKLSAVPVKPDEQKDAADLFIHTTIFVVVDKHAQLRGIFETGGEGVDWTNAVQPKILAAVRQLESEP